jgi:Outer membrane protein beta-barrel domain
LITRLSFFAVATVLMLGVNSASAQEAAAARNTISASTGSMNFDLSGTGNTWNVAVRGTRALTSNLALEVGGLFARPELQGGIGTLFLPEAQVQYHWRAGNVAPYVGGGIGFIHQRRDVFGSTNNFALSAAGGARFYFNDRVAALGEFRLHTIERDFTGTTAEIMGGLSYGF